ncbi:MAG: hypothetical protein LBN10_07640 [Propionibacteriaceae bacterium]|jgi:hypothetical protein|nr:hypothetical protein [Propionibacteriaceae bacterium]
MTTIQHNHLLDHVADVHPVFHHVTRDYGLVFPLCGADEWPALADVRCDTEAVERHGTLCPECAEMSDDIEVSAAWPDGIYGAILGIQTPQP